MVDAAANDAPVVSPKLRHSYVIVTSSCNAVAAPGVINNKDQSSLAKGGIAAASPPNSSFVFARWQRQFEIACFDWGLDPQKSPVPMGPGTPI